MGIDCNSENRSCEIPVTKTFVDKSQEIPAFRRDGP